MVVRSRLRGVYAVGRPELTRNGGCMAAVLACGDGAVLSHESAATLWEIRNGERLIEVSLAAPFDRRPSGIHVHRRVRPRPADVTTRHNIPLTSPVRTLIDLAPRLIEDQLEAAINEAVKHDYVDPHPATGERVPRRLLLARARAHLRDGRLALSPNPTPAGA
jgi:hypothetical protein